MKPQTFPHDRHRYCCESCGLVVITVLPVRSRGGAYECDRCGRFTRHEVTLLPGTDRQAKQKVAE